MKQAVSAGSLAISLILTWLTYAMAEPEWRPPSPDGDVDYQLGGAYPPDGRVTIVVRDSTARPAAGLYNICYINAFQTQPDDLDRWLKQHSIALLRDSTGAPIADPGWPDEYALNTQSVAARAEIADVIGSVIRHCAAAGFDAVELDNLDSWTRFAGLTLEGNLALATTLIEQAHGLGLAVAQKNAPDLEKLGPQVGFDFAISEECARWNECSLFHEHYGALHINVEYHGALPDGLPFQAICRLPDQPKLTVLRDQELTTPDHANYVFELCR